MTQPGFYHKSLNDCHLRDGSGTITYDEFKNVFSANLGPGSIPFDFDWCASLVHIVNEVNHITLLSDWVKLYLGKKDGTHVLGCEFFS